jgi:hypothetical protein
MRTGLVLPYMLGLDVISFSEHVFVVFLFIGFQQKQKKQKKIGENLQDIFFSWHIKYCMYFLLISKFFGY